ncbi:6-hydroxymethylpterin diphosphokinase MptE-like protein [Clostridium saccharoperbutylacetonicum]|uniref:6-hydroxymethylpterin diphosphokinase MptE-like protein n=1 Tax=Clostridium saccharoperbutylacetonicum TaxID=36745 RepID=UPI000983C28F|nr:6-hydroxymethylpterin diphosphokinase MptE-like protein [Clostridium saccharoperbutylacetonicum]AQR97004.1 hypothetical protein CLSAP_43280 [Clostridium saccharoperbutylacetonicum]NSB32883.1 hypothetical protein [Clostridium saccharoperbutylacetonicum]
MKAYNVKVIDDYKESLIILYGASLQGKNVLDMLLRAGIKPTYFCDNDPNKWGNKVNDIEVISIDMLKKLYLKENNRKIKIIITSMYINEIMYDIIENEIECDLEPYYYTKFVFDAYFLSINAGKIRPLKDKYLGERCFVIGNGPSLTPHDLDLLKNEYTFASNKIFYIFDKTEWRPTFYGCVDDTVVNSGYMVDEFINMKVEKMFLLDNWQYNKNIYGLDKVMFLKSKDKLDKRKIEFNYDISKPMHIYYVTNALIEIATYMGFKKIYLLGVDMTFPTEKEIKEKKYHNYHFDKRYVEDKEIEIAIPKSYNYEDDVKFTINSYNIMKRYLEKNEMEIYNATRGGKLEVFERVEFDSIIKK